MDYKKLIDTLNGYIEDCDKCEYSMPLCEIQLGKMAADAIEELTNIDAQLMIDMKKNIKECRPCSTCKHDSISGCCQDSPYDCCRDNNWEKWEWRGIWND